MVMRSVTPSFFLLELCRNCKQKAGRLEIRFQCFLYGEAHFLYNQPDTAELHGNFVDEITIRTTGVSCEVF